MSATVLRQRTPWQGGEPWQRQPPASPVASSWHGCGRLAPNTVTLVWACPVLPPSLVPPPLLLVLSELLLPSPTPRPTPSAIVVTATNTATRMHFRLLVARPRAAELASELARGSLQEGWSGVRGNGGGSWLERFELECGVIPINRRNVAQHNGARSRQREAA